MNDDLKMFTVEYALAVGNRFDGQTPAPAFSTDPTSPNYHPPGDDQIFRFELDQDLGIIDPDFGIGGAEGDRFIQLLDIELPAVDSLSLAVADFRLVGENDGIPQEVLVPFTNLQRYYNDGCIFVPQGSVLAVMSDVTNGISRLRYNVVVPNDRPDLARLLEQCCCIDNALEPVICDPPVLEGLFSSEFQTPAFLTPNTNGQVALFGSGLDEADSYRLVGPDPVPTLTVNTTLPGAILFDYESGDLVPNSTWSLEACRAGNPSCCAVIQEAALFPPCLEFTRINPTQFLVNSGIQNIGLLGANFDVVGVDNIIARIGGTDIFVGGSITINNNLDLDFSIDTAGAPIGVYEVILQPPAASGCPDLVIPNAFSIVTP